MFLRASCCISMTSTHFYSPANLFCVPRLSKIHKTTVFNYYCFIHTHTQCIKVYLVLLIYTHVKADHFGIDDCPPLRSHQLLLAFPLRLGPHENFLVYVDISAVLTTQVLFRRLFSQGFMDQLPCQIEDMINLVFPSDAKKTQNKIKIFFDEK